MNKGKIFETAIKNSVPKDCYYFRLHDPAQSFDQSSTLRFSLPNPYDCLLFCYPTLFALELKSTESTSMGFWREDFVDKTKKQTFMIKKNQIKGLDTASQFKGVVAGFLLNWRKTNHTYFWNINDFLEFTNMLDKKSFNEEDVISHNGMLIEQTLKKVNYKYNLENLCQLSK